LSAPDSSEETITIVELVPETPNEQAELSKIKARYVVDDIDSDDFCSSEFESSRRINPEEVTARRREGVSGTA